MKSDWWDNRLRLNVAAFWNKYTDLQVSVFDGGIGFVVGLEYHDPLFDPHAADGQLTHAPGHRLWSPCEFQQRVGGGVVAPGRRAEPSEGAGSHRRLRLSTKSALVTRSPPRRRCRSRRGRR